MSDETKNAGRPTRPDIGGSQQEPSNFERVDDFEIEVNATTVLEEGKDHDGKITECYGLKNDSGEMLIKVVITLEDGSAHEFLNNLKYSPLKKLIAETEWELQRRVKPFDLVGMWVRFTVKYNKGYWNLKIIVQIDAPDDAEVDN